MTLQSVTIPAVAISQDERAFFIDLGARIARLRKEQSITQVQFAELLGTSQQAITAYEVGRRRVPVSSLPAIAKLLSVSVEELLGEENRSSASSCRSSTR